MCIVGWICCAFVYVFVLSSVPTVHFFYFAIYGIIIQKVMLMGLFVKLMLYHQ